MPSVRLWVPESDYDRGAVCCIAQKIVDYYECELKIEYADKTAFNTAIHPRSQDKGGLKKAVSTYLKKNDLVIFLLDSDGTQSQSQRRKETNSLVNRIQEVVNSSEGKVKFFPIVEELEAWLLVDCLGICCHFTKNADHRNNQEWIKFANSQQRGQTDLIAEAVSGGNGAKECLIDFSSQILIKINPHLKNKPRNLKESEYQENQSSKVAQYIEINNQTIKRNKSLHEFAQCLKELAEDK